MSKFDLSGGSGRVLDDETQILQKGADILPRNRANLVNLALCYEGIQSVIGDLLALLDEDLGNGLDVHCFLLCKWDVCASNAGIVAPPSARENGISSRCPHSGSKSVSCGAPHRRRISAG